MASSDDDQQALAEWGAGEQRPEGACINYADCGNIPPGNNTTCADCLDEMRHSDSGDSWTELD